jgi:hypothetical protein
MGYIWYLGPLNIRLGYVLSDFFKMLSAWLASICSLECHNLPERPFQNYEDSEIDG